MDGSSESMQVFLWMMLGLTLLSSEAFTGSFHLLFFGLAALLVASLAGLGLDLIWLQISLFLILSFISALLVHERMRRRSTDEFETGPESLFKIWERFEPLEEKDLIYQGAPWRAINRSSRALEPGEVVVVTRTEGITLVLESRST